MGTLSVKEVIALVGTVCFLVIVFVLGFVVLSYVLSKKEITKDSKIVFFGGIKFFLLVIISVAMMAQESKEISNVTIDLINSVRTFVRTFINHGSDSSSEPPKPTKPPEKVNFEGKYIYMSEPNHKTKQIDKPVLLIGEDRKDYYQFIGTAEISKDANTGSISVCGLRQFSVSLDSDRNVIINETDVHWYVDRSRAFLPQGGESEMIFILRTELPRGAGDEGGGSDLDHNLAIYLGKNKPDTDKDKDKAQNGYAKWIEGDMYYLNYHQQNNTQGRMNPSWTHAKMVLERVGNFEDDHEFIKKSYENFKTWFRVKFGIEINKVQFPNSYKRRAPKSVC